MVKRQKILTDFELQKLKELYDELKDKDCTRFFHQWDNLYDVSRTQLTPQNKRATSYIDHAILQKLADHFNMIYENSYFLSYKRGSFTASHVDTDRSKKTLITLISKTDNLDGGDVIVTRPLPDRPLRGDARGKKINPVGKNIIPELWKQEVGDTLIYDGNTIHGVTRVKRGERIVLVSWLKEK
jgi:predicted 2-oxoglutarate/Fe(II)-dependent dioxygenase YbiX